VKLTGGGIVAALLLGAGPAQVRPGEPGRPGWPDRGTTGPGLVASLRRAGVARPDGGTGTKAVSYLGYRFLVPRGWPVIDDARDRSGCVRFDRQAVYLGGPASGERCPESLAVTTESVLIEPGPARGRVVATEDPFARQVTVRAPGLLFMATFGAHPGVIDQILASAGLPVPRSASGASKPAPDLLWKRPHRTGAGRRPVPPPPLPPTVVDYTGLGFDTCAAPSRATMRTWLHRSFYRAIGIYIGGADLTCPQPNLTSGWVRAEAAAGWRFMPLYGGPQANLGQLVAPSRQGKDSALDAVVQARRLGLAPQTPLYYDMEGFPAVWNAQALAFMSAWTRELHLLGYQSGVYSSGDSGIADLVKHYHDRGLAMPDIIYDARWNGVHSTADKLLRHLWWNKRIHQFTGKRTQTFGGVTIVVSRDFLGVRTDLAYVSAFTSQPTPAVNLPGGGTMVFYRGPGRRLWRDQYKPGRGWAKPVPVGVRAWSAPSAVWTGSTVAVFYKGASGRLWVLSYQENGRRAGRGILPMMGQVGLGPYAVSQPGGVIDLFWQGPGDRLWHGQFTPGAGWTGPQELAGAAGAADALTTAPSVVTSSPGSTAVFWRGRHDSLWTINRGLAGTWSRPRRLRLPAAGAPEATAEITGGIEVYWAGAGHAGLREAFDRPGAGWHGPRDLGGQVHSAPLAATAAGAVRVLWLGAGHSIEYVEHRSGSNWNAAGWTRPAAARVGWVGSAPFAAIGGRGRTLRIFWTGRDGRVRTATLTRNTWSRPFSL
jgi:Domain of unknown function (DUF1906)